MKEGEGGRERERERERESVCEREKKNKEEAILGPHFEQTFSQFKSKDPLSKV